MELPPKWERGSIQVWVRKMALNIVVFIKWVPNTQVVNIDPRTGTLIREGVPSIVNPHDLHAVEFALKLKERYGGKVTALSMAPPSALKGIEFVVGMGVDNGILLSDRAFAGADTLATSYVLANAVKKLGEFDLLIFGQETIDSSTAHIGAQTASWLNLPYIYYVLEAELVDEKKIVVKRTLERSLEWYELPLPAVIGVAMGSNPPRPIRLKEKLRAKLEKPMETWTNQNLGLDPLCIGLRGSPTRVVKSIPTPTVPRKKEKFEGDPVEGARWLVQKLREEGLI